MLSEKDQGQFDELVAARQKRKLAYENAEREYTKANLEIRAFLALHGIVKERTTNGFVAEVTEVIDWQHIDAELVQEDFPMDEYPQVYAPSYKALKAAANERVHAKDPESTAAVSKYTGFVPQLRVRKAQKRIVRRKKK